MTVTPLAIVALLAWLVWLGRRAPLSGWRRAAVLGLRAAALLLLCAALTGSTRRRVETAPRHLVYLADVSSSMDASQRAWMAARIAALDAARPAAMPRTLVAFGADAATVVPAGQGALTDPARVAQALERAAVDRRSTNLEAALLSLVAAVPPGRPAGVVLFSDGQETAGNVSGALAAVRQLGLSVYPVTPPRAAAAQAAWDRLDVPPVVQQGASIPVQLVIVNSGSRATSGEVSVAIQGVPVKRQRLLIRPGWQVFTVGVPAVGRGSAALDVELRIPEDRLDERRRAHTDVEGPPRVLLVQPQAPALPPLAAALKRREIDVAALRPAELPSDPARLSDYDAVLLHAVPKSALSAEQVAALEVYIRTRGGGLVMVGLGGDLAQELAAPAPLDALLPVRLEPKGLQEAQRRVCMILLIDRSASMLGPRIAATKRAAIALINQLAPEDLVGILAFDVQPYVVAEVQPAAQVTGWVVDKLASLRSSGGTDIYPALAAAHNRLDLTGATVKHVILLSDGNTPVNERSYRALFERFRRERISISTIGVGAAFINDGYLKWLSQETGGTFYQLRQLEELPRLVARDAEQATGRLPFVEGRFQPSRAASTDWFEEIADWPPLRGYLTATPKSGAQVDLVVNGGEAPEPLLARWWVGQGRVVSFLSDADLRWSPDWVRWPSFGGVWAHIVRWAMRPRLAEEIFVRVDDSGRVPRLLVDGMLDDPSAALLPPEEPRMPVPLALVQTGPWSWEASLEQTLSGWYQLRLEEPPQPASGPASPSPSAPAAAGPPRFATRWVLVGTPPAAGQERPGAPRDELLRHIARATGGAVDAPDQALLPPTTTVTVTEPLFAWWLPVALLLFLADIALRGGTMLG